MPKLESETLNDVDTREQEDQTSRQRTTAVTTNETAMTTMRRLNEFESMRRNHTIIDIAAEAVYNHVLPLCELLEECSVAA